MLPVTALKDMFPVIMTPSHDGKYFHKGLRKQNATKVDHEVT
jgi:hypothetical protein